MRRNGHRNGVDAQNGDAPHRLSLWLKRRRLETYYIQKVAQIALEVGSDVPERKWSAATAAGDWRKLRGIPAVGRGVTGAVRGTRPGDGLE